MNEAEPQQISWQERLAQIVGSQDEFQVSPPMGTVRIERLDPQRDFSDWKITILRPEEVVEKEEFELKEDRGLVSIRLLYRTPVQNVAGIGLGKVCNLVDVNEKGVLEDWEIGESEVLDEYLDEFHGAVTQVMQFVESVLNESKQV